MPADRFQARERLRRYLLSTLVEPNAKLMRASFESTWGEDLSASERAKKSRMLASVIFIESGRRMEHFSNSGERVLFAPEERDVSMRSKQLHLDEQLRLQGQRFLLLAIAAIIAPVMAAGIGFRWPGKDAGQYRTPLK